jgi:glutamyl-tRNA synthetase
MPATPTSPVRLRFAPSPTGYLHIGGVRTALFNWLYARHAAGVFILRIEDTDRERSTPEAIRAILDGLSWCGLDWDEGPYYQTERLDLYRSAVDRLLAAGRAYYCTCTPETLEAERRRALAEGRKPMYPGTCRGRSGRPAGPHAIRFVAPQTGATTVDDLIKGPVSFDNAELDDLVIQRSDGWPTYNFAVVVDDADMRITHVVRGDDHLANTPRQIAIYEALGLPRPRFGHVSMIMGPDRQKLSKRHGATAITEYRDMGYLPEAMDNYLVRLGWSHGDQEIFSLDEMIRLFDWPAVGKSAAVFNPEKLLWVNHQWIKRADPERLARLLVPLLEERGFRVAVGPDLVRIVRSLQERSKTLVEMADFGAFYFRDAVEYDPKAAEKHLTPTVLEPLRELIGRLEAAAAGGFAAPAIERAFEAVIGPRGMKLGALAQPARVAVTGTTISPGIFDTLEALGPERSLARLRAAVRYIERRSGVGA